MTRRDRRNPRARPGQRARTALAALAAALALLVVPAPTPAPAEPPIWRLEQPPPPAGLPFKVPLGEPGDLSFWAPNRGLLTVGGNDTIPPGIFSWNGQSWHQLATVCGGGGDTSRIAWAGPDEFWVLTAPSLPRLGAGLSLCHFLNGQVVASYSTPPESSDPFRQMLSAACNGPGDCWFGGVGSQDAVGERVGAFHLHWDGSSLVSVYGPQGRGVSDMEFHGGKLYESTLVGRSPEDRDETVDLAEPEPLPRLIHTISGHTFGNDPFTPSAFAAGGTELLALDGAGSSLWAVGGGAASGPSAPSGGSVPRPPLAARLVGAKFEELTLSGGAVDTSDRFGDVAALPGTNAAMATQVPFADRHSTNSKAKVATIAGDGTVTTTVLPAAGAGRGSAARIACPAADDCWMVTWGGWLFHYGDGSPEAVDTDPNFQGTIVFRPNEAAEQFIPDALPEDDSQLFAPPPLETGKEEGRKAKVRRLPPLLRNIHSELHGLRLVVTFVVTRRARVQLLAKRRGRVVARTPRRVLSPGHRALSLQLSRREYPTGLAFRTKEVKR
ncbi:MAG TPA: hypothetical protein VG898_02700 [Solirubrobacterales bacterium]|nr:hypothetical protein [Solirubrobacterales bacterium]